ncbi:MAG: glycosyltransferase [Bacteroidota bacterium]
MNLSLSVIVPTHQLSESFATCLRALERAAETLVFELVLVLDGVTPDIYFFEKFHLPRLRIVTLAKNYGPAVARNQGARVARGKVLLFLDADVRVHPTTLPQVLEHFEKEPTADALIGSYDEHPAEDRVVSRFRNLLHHYTHQRGATEASTFWGACGAVRSAVFQGAGGFNESFAKPSVEDVELGYRLRAQGYRIALCKGIQVTHLKRWDLRSMVFTDVFRRAKPWTVLLLQHQQWQHNDLNVKYTERWTTVAIFILLISGGLSVIASEFLWLAALAGLAIILLNRPFYRFLGKHFKVYQWPLVLALHGIYHLSAALGLALGLVEYQYGKAKQTWQKLSVQA